jgi:uncharacterized protein YjbI with pentapeptide repeats
MTRAEARGIDLRSAYLRGTVLDEADLNGANLSKADLQGSSVHGTSFVYADLRRAVLSGLQNWKDIHDLRLANVDGVVDPPFGFVRWAVGSAGAVSITSDREWVMRKTVDSRDKK